MVRGDRPSPARGVDRASRGDRWRFGLAAFVALTAAGPAQAEAIPAEAAAIGATPPDLAATPPKRPSNVRVIPYLTLAGTTRNLTFGGRLTIGRTLGPSFSGSLGGDWLLSGLVSGFLLDDIGSPRMTASQLAVWTVRWPQVGGALLFGPGARWLPRVAFGVGVWETAEVDSLLQTMRTEDYGIYASLSTGAQVALVFPYVSLAFGVHPFAASAYVRGDEVFPTSFQLGNVLLDVDFTLDLQQIWYAGRPEHNR